MGLNTVCVSIRTLQNLREANLKKRLLKNLEVSAIGYGVMGFSHGYGVLPPKEDAIQMIRVSYDLGCTFFDTAEGYGAGANEELLGEALAPIRKHVVIATKLHIRSGEGGSLNQQSIPGWIHL